MLHEGYQNPEWGLIHQIFSPVPFFPLILSGYVHSSLGWHQCYLDCWVDFMRVDETAYRSFDVQTFKGEGVNEQAPATTICDNITSISDIYCGT